MAKLGRNQPCWCGSGKKYKRCHLHTDERARGGSKFAKPLDQNVLREILARQKAQEAVREHMQGKGKPIISADFQGYKLIAVGNTLHWSKLEKTQTFVDFLGNYLRSVLTPEWGNAEIAKPLEDRHPVMQWYDGLCRLQQKHYKPGRIFDTPATGLVMAYNCLAYNLYLLGHNAEVQRHLIGRLKDRNSFYSALYETHVAAWFILAGFKLSLENERDPTSSHCEFTAEAPSGQCYSVEAKCRQPGKGHLAIGNQLYKALGKIARYPRIVCIDMNVRHETMGDPAALMDDIAKRLKKKESSLTIKGEAAPPAFLFITNIPHHLHLEDENTPRALLAEGFKIPDFGTKTFPSISAAYKARIKHGDVLSVAHAFQNYQVPSTFDGELPEFAFGDAERRFVIGDRYKMDDGTIGALRQGVVIEHEKSAILVYETDDGKHLMYKGPLSDAELSAYKSHPETFFGKVEHVGRTADTAMELYDFFYDAHKNAPREKLLEWFASSPDIEELRKLPTDELRFVCAERYTIGAIGDNEVPDLVRAKGNETEPSG